MTSGDLKLPEPRNFSRVTIATIACLVTGFIIGLSAHDSSSTFFESLYLVFKPIEQSWMMMIRVVVIPLMFLYIVVAVAGRPRDGGTSKAVKSAALIHVVLLTLTLMFTLAWMPLLLSWFKITPEIETAFQASAASATADYPFEVPAHIQRIWEVLFDHPILDAVYGQILIILVVAFVAAFGLLRLPERFRIPILRVSTQAANACMVVVTWILYLMPLGVFALSYTVAMAKGVSLLSAVLFFIAIVSGLLIAVMLILYPVTAAYARIPIKRFAKAAAPAQSVAFGTRSSLMCLATLTSGAENVLGIPRKLTSVILPVSVSTFKLNRMVSTPAKLFFLAHLYSIELDLLTAATLLAFAFVKSFGTAGIPSGGSMTTLPLYLAAGIPLEGVVILKAVDAVPDIFKTMLNATEDLAVITMATRAGGIPFEVPDATTTVITAGSVSSSMMPAQDSAVFERSYSIPGDETGQ